jgi:thioredoxin-related protein
MNNRLILTTLLTLLISVCFRADIASGAEKKSGVAWLKYDQALEQAKKQKKHVLVDFATKWCGYCKKMQATTYQDTKILETMAKDFVAAEVDGDSYNVIKLKDGDITEKGLTLQYGVRGYPTTWFLESDGKKIAPVSGYLDAKQLQYILDFVRTNSNDKMSFQEYVAQQTLKSGSK